MSVRVGGRGVRVSAGPAAPAETVASLLGAGMFADYWASDRYAPTQPNPRIAVAGAAVTSWPEEQGRNAPLAQADGARRPVLGAASYNGLPGVTFDGVNDSLIADLLPALAVGSRFYSWMAFRFTTVATPDYGTVWSLDTGGDFVEVGITLDTNASDKFGSSSELSDGNDSTRTYLWTVDTAYHVMEYGLLAALPNKYVLDGAGSAGLVVGTTLAEFDRLELGNQSVSAFEFAAPICVSRFVLSHDPANPTALPDAATIAAVRARVTANQR